MKKNQLNCIVLTKKYVEIAINKIIIGQFHARRFLDPIQISNLAKSIKKYGIIQPIVVKLVAEGYELCCGLRRLKAAQMAEMTHIPCVISEENKIEISLAENLMREDLHPFDEAVLLKGLQEESGLKQCEMVERFHLSSTEYLSSTLLINNINDDIKEKIIKDNLLSKNQLIRIGRKKNKSDQYKQYKIEMKKCTKKNGNRTKTQVLAEKSEFLRQQIEKLHIRKQDQKYAKKIRKDSLKIIDEIDKKISYASDKRSILLKMFHFLFAKNKRNVENGIIV